MTLNRSSYLTTIGISIYAQPLQWIQQCITSALNQTAQNIELLVRCDGPTAIDQRSKDWLRQLARQEARLKLIEGDVNLGTFGSLQKLFQNAQGESLVQLDADDALHPRAIELANLALERDPRLSFVYTKCIEIDSTGNCIGEGTRQRMPCTDLNLLIQFMTFHLRCIRRECYEAVGGYRSALLFSGDYDLSLRLAEVGGIGFLPLPLYYYRIHEKNTSKQQYQATVLEAFQVARDALYRRGLADRAYLCLTADNRVRRVDLGGWDPNSEKRKLSNLIFDATPSRWL